MPYMSVWMAIMTFGDSLIAFYAVPYVLQPNYLYQINFNLHITYGSTYMILRMSNGMLC